MSSAAILVPWVLRQSMARMERLFMTQRSVAYFAMRLACALTVATLLGCAPGSVTHQEPLISIEPTQVTVAQQSTVTVRVDNPNGGPAAFASDLPEDLTHIRITTAPCPAGAGVSPSCQLWSITPLPESVPGIYDLHANPINSNNTASLRIIVDPAPPVHTPPVIF